MPIINTTTKNGAKILVETLKDIGINKIFGYPGGMVLKVYDELKSENEIEHILVRHEQSAVHAAEGYARVSDKIGVVLVTSGPGATNTVTGILNAYHDGYPLMVITGQVQSDLIGNNAFQEADICAMTKSCTKKTYQITNIKDLQNTLYEAYQTAMSDKKGPVLVDIAKDVFTQNFGYKKLEKENSIQNNPNNIQKAIELLLKAQYPIIIAGGGSNSAYIELRKLSESLNIPTVNTMMATGVCDNDSNLHLGMIGIFGDNSANEAIKKSDLIFSVGCRFNDRITCCFDKNILNSKIIIQIDINPNEISHITKTDSALIGDSKIILTEILNFINNNSIKLSNNLWTENDIARLKSTNKIPTPKTNQIHSFEAVNILNEVIANKDYIVTTEVGQHQLWATRNLKFNKPNRFLTSGGLGTMGFGLPAAIGAAIYDKSKPVICITGDGSFQMTLHELATCKDYNLPVKIIILNNGYLGMVRQLQENFCDGRYYQTKISSPDFVKIAESYGIEGIRVTSKNELKPVFEKIFKTNDPAIVEIAIEPFEVL